LVSSWRRVAAFEPGVEAIDSMAAVVIISNMKAEAELLLHQRQQLDSKSFVELRIWRVPQPVRASSHQYKYSLAYVVESQCVLRYDNEAGKGDHVHRAEEGRPYEFTTPEKLLSDFWSDVDKWRSK
jgi:hypothetical protein